MHEDPGTEKEGKQQLVFLKQTATHIGVQTECEVVIDVLDTLIDVICQTIIQQFIKYQRTLQLFACSNKKNSPPPNPITTFISC